MGKGSTQTTTTAPNPSALAAYQDVVGKAQSVASTPYQPYTGNLVAGINGGQQQAIGELQGSYGLANPFINAGSSYLDNASAGLGGVQNYLQAGSQSVGQAQGYAGQAAGLANPNAVSQYLNPYQQSVIDTTMAQAHQNDAIQSQQLASGAIGAGAFGGDRAGIAQATLAGQQALANNQTVAGLNAQNYAQAEQARQADASLYGNLANSANQSAGLFNSLGQTQATSSAAQGQLANLSGYLGQTAQNTAIQGASAGLQGSTLEQQNEQQQDTAAYGQYQNALAYPFQTTGWLSNIVQGIGANSGSSTTSPGPSTLSQIAGAGTAGLGILGATGAFGSGTASSGSGWLGSGLYNLFSGNALGGGYAEGGVVSGYAKGGAVGAHGLSPHGHSVIHVPGRGLVPVSAPYRTGFGERRPMPVAMSEGEMRAMGLEHPGDLEGAYARGGSVGRGHFLDGGDVGLTDPTASVGVNVPVAAIPDSGLNFTPSGLTQGGLAGISSAPISSSGGLGAGGAGAAGRAPAYRAPTQPQGLGVVSGSPSGSSASGGGGSPDDNGDLWRSVIAAGFGMMGGSSPSAGVNIGQGGLAGIREYQTLQQEHRQNAYQQQELDLKKNAQQFDQNQVLYNRALAQSVFGGQPAANGSSPAAAPAAPVNSGSAGLSGASGSAPVDSGAVGLGGGAAAPQAGSGLSPAPSAPAPSAQAGATPDLTPQSLTQIAAQNQRRGDAFAAGGDMATANRLYSAAENARSLADNMLSRGQQFSGGQIVPIPGSNETTAAKSYADQTGRSSAEANFKFHEVQPTPGGPTMLVRDSDLAQFQSKNPDATPINPGAGSPPGASMNAAAAQNPMIAKQPAFIEEQQKKIAEDDAAMTDQYRTRQLSLQRLNALNQIQQRMQTGTFAEQKADVVGMARAAGLNIGDSDTANPAALQEYVKNSTANIFNDAKAVGGRVLVTELEGLKQANANPNLQPEANAAIISQGIGVIRYEDQHYNDYMAWRQDHPYATAPQIATQFEAPWTKANPVQSFVNAASKDVTAKGITVPAPAQRVQGQVYVTPKGTYRWMGGGWAAVN